METFRRIPQFMIASPASDSGKTTLCRGLLAALKQRRMRVQPFKCGPDYIDPMFHTQICEVPSYNLDTFMASDRHVRRLYAAHASRTDVCVVEGMMGMFDGYDGQKGSSAEIAALLRIPVVLVVHARSAAFSVVVQAKGFIDFDPSVRVAGVIFNRVRSDRHERLLRDISHELGITCFGCVRDQEGMQFASRYLGLDISRMPSGPDEEMARFIERSIDIDHLLQSTLCTVPALEWVPHISCQGLEICVPKYRDAFAFCYAEHLDILHAMGKVRYFSPVTSSKRILFEHADLIYLPGGYPESYMNLFSRRDQLREALHRYVERGGRVLAECGGMIWLARSYTEWDTAHRPMDVLPIDIELTREHRRTTLGYRRFRLAGREVRGHEFHRSQLAGRPDIESVAGAVYNAQGEMVDMPVFRYKNVIASYVHMYWGETDPMKLFD